MGGMWTNGKVVLQPYPVRELGRQQIRLGIFIAQPKIPEFRRCEREVWIHPPFGFSALRRNFGPIDTRTQPRALREPVFAVGVEAGSVEGVVFARGHGGGVHAAEL